MLDAIKGLAGGGKARKQTEELEALIATAREERSALSAMLAQVTMRGTKLTETGKALEQVEAKAIKATGSLDALVKRIEELEQQAKALGDVQARAQALEAAISLSQAKTEQLIAPNGDLEQHRRQIQQLSTQAAEASSTVETAKRERAALEEYRTQLRQAHVEMKEIRLSVDQATGLRGELEQLREVAGQLAHDYGRLRETSRDAREDSAIATSAVKEVENKLGRLTHLQELSQATEEKLIALNGLAEHVNQKTKVLDGQKHIVDRAVIQANHVNELVWNMDVQIGKLNEGLKEAARGEETAGRIEKLVEDIHGRVGTATRARDELMHETARMEKDGRALVETVHTNLETLALEKREFEAFSERLRALQDALQKSEQRMDALGVKERQLSTLPQRIDEFSRSFEVLLGQADELTGKQTSLDRLREGLTHVDDLTARAVAQHQTLTQSRADLEVLRKQIHDFHRSYADAAQLRDKIGADRVALEACADRLAAFRARAPELEATLNAILGKMSLVDEGIRHADGISHMATELEAQVTRVTERTEVVGLIQERLNMLHAVASEVDKKLAEQLARRVELDTLKAQCDGVIAQMIDAQQKVDAVAAMQGRVLPMEIRLTILQDRLEKTGTRVKEVQLDETTLVDQEARLTDLVDKARSLATEAADRMQQAQALAAQVARTSAARDELIEELARVQARQRDAVGQAEAAEDQLRRTETMYVALEQRRSQLAFSEKKLATVEAKMADLAQKSTGIEQKIKTLDDRDAVVAAVRSEVDNIHQISAKSREDLQYVSDHREQVAALRRQVDELLTAAGGAQRAIGAIDARRRDIEEVQSKTTLISNLLEDVRVNLETVGEQKAVVDHVIDRLAKLEFVTVEAQNTLRMLSQERELAERIEQSIKQLRGRAGASSEEGRQSA